VPSPQKTQIRFAAGTAVTFEMVALSAPHANALSYVRIDPRSGQVLDYVPHAANRLAHKAYLFAAALHYGWIGGVPGQLLLMLAALAVPVLAWTGTASFLRGRRPRPARRLRVIVASKTGEAQDVCSFELVGAEGQDLPRFSAGAHIDVHLSGGLIRQYSLCNDPRETHRYLIGVMHAADSRGGSRAMHQALRVGDSIEIGVPKNHFPLAPGAARSLLFAGGIGITPIISMAERLAGAGADFTLHYCARSPQRAAFRKRIAQSGYADRVAFHYSEEARIDLAALLASPDPGTHLYVCGPAGFMDAVIAGALAHGWRADQVHREYFAAAALDHAGDRAFDIKIASSGAIIHVARDMTALGALAAHGIVVPSSCQQGVCGTCITGVLDGEPDHRDVYLGAGEHARNDRFTPCCSRSCSAMLTLNL
jgi:ferredoxin-NADP reductase